MSRTLALVLAGALTGCATIVQGPAQRVSFQTQPAGATVQASSQACTTPCSLRLARNQRVGVQIHKDGYAPESVAVSYDVDPWILGNLAFLVFAPVGGVVDLVSGAGFRLHPQSIDVSLRKTEPPPPPPAQRPRPAPEGDEPRAPGTVPDSAEWKPIPED